LIGRSPTCDIRVDYPIVSNRHCALVYDGTNWTIQDLNSRNGTKVNEVRVTTHVLKSGDTLAVAAKFRFVIEFDPAVERKRFVEAPPDAGSILAGDDRTYAEHGPATKRLEPHDKDIWSKFEK
jgi:pSer/pThr/pTyr-binding forkhead associated (FHA) protein